MFDIRKPIGNFGIRIWKKHENAREKMKRYPFRREEISSRICKKKRFVID
jgi:hypothetical protein